MKRTFTIFAAILLLAFLTSCGPKLTEVAPGVLVSEHYICTITTLQNGGRILTISIPDRDNAIMAIIELPALPPKVEK